MGYSPWGRKESDMTEQLTHIDTTYVILDNPPTPSESYTPPIKTE